MRHSQQHSLTSHRQAHSQSAASYVRRTPISDISYTDFAFDWQINAKLCLKNGSDIYPQTDRLTDR